MAERNRYGQERYEDRNRESEWNREHRPGHEGEWEGRGYSPREQGYGQGGFSQWEGRGAWQPARHEGHGGYGPQGGFQGTGYGSQGGWDLDEGRFQTGRAASGWRGPQAGRGFEQAGYGAGGFGGYGTPGYGSRGYGPEEHRGSEEWRRQGTPEAPGSSYGGYAPQGFGGYGTRGGNYGGASSGRWMGEGYGGPSPEETRSGRYDMGRWGTIGRSGRGPQEHWPKSYTRSDERIREDLYERIVHHNYIDASDVAIAVSDGRVTLEGSVPERHMKHDIENIADECPGVKDIDNRIRVHSKAEHFEHAPERAAGTPGRK